MPITIHTLRYGPSAREVELVDTKLLLTISIPDAGINVMVVKHRTKRRIADHTLTTWSIDEAMGLEDSSTTTLEARLAALVDLSLMLVQADYPNERWGY
jgi:hypothetical protein